MGLYPLAYVATLSQSTLAAIGLVFDDKEIATSRTGLTIQRCSRIARSVDIAGGIASNGLGIIRTCRAELARPLFHTACVVLGDKEIVISRTDLTIQTTACISCHIDVTDSISSDSAGDIITCGAELACPRGHTK